MSTKKNVLKILPLNHVVTKTCEHSV